MIGAGPAGSVAGYVLAKEGFSVLLIDKDRFPRHKVCGACINEKTLSILDRLDLADALREFNPHPISEFRLAHGRRQGSVFLRGGLSLSRERFDYLLAVKAKEAGVYFLDGAHAILEPESDEYREIQIEQSGVSAHIQARIVLVADGIGGNSLQRIPESKPVIASKSRFGLGAVLDEGPSFYKPGVIYMAVEKQGYAGVVRLEDGRFNIAAALDTWKQNEGFNGPAEAVKMIFSNAGFPEFSQLKNSDCRGTPLLTRRRKIIAGRRFFVIGDAASYAEPFTGEGMEWAVTTGEAAARLACEGIREWKPFLEKRWNQMHQKLIRQRQILCRLVSFSLRNSFVTQFGMNFLSRGPEV